jgi:hypothetical protein
LKRNNLETEQVLMKIRQSLLKSGFPNVFNTLETIYTKKEPTLLKTSPETRARNHSYYHSSGKSVRRRKTLLEKGWTPELFAQALQTQENKCDICGLPFTETDPARADHVHGCPPKHRGLLHTTCNSGLGMFKDNPEILESAATYLRKWL